MDKRIVLNNIDKTFISKTGESIQVFKKANLEIATDKITVLLGKSGIGKTTLLRMIGGLDNEYEGSIDKAGLHFSFVFQEPNLMPWLNVWDNVIFGLNKKDVNEDKVRELLEFIRFNNRLHSYPFELSGGMKQRVALARALCVECDFLLMDEPFASLDVEGRREMQDLIKKVVEQKKVGVLFVTHNIEESMKIADEIIVIKNESEFEKLLISNENRTNLDMENKICSLINQ